MVCGRYEFQFVLCLLCNPLRYTPRVGFGIALFPGCRVIKGVPNRGLVCFVSCDWFFLPVVCVTVVYNVLFLRVWLSVPVQSIALKIISDITYNVPSDTLNPSRPFHTVLSVIICCDCCRC